MPRAVDVVDSTQLLRGNVIVVETIYLNNTNELLLRINACQSASTVEPVLTY